MPARSITRGDFKRWPKQHTHNQGQVFLFDTEHSVFQRGCYNVLDMKGEAKERWMQLAERVATEQDPVKLLQLIGEIDALLAEKQERLVKNDPIRATPPL